MADEKIVTTSFVFSDEDSNTMTYGPVEISEQITLGNRDIQTAINEWCEENTYEKGTVLFFDDVTKNDRRGAYYRYNGESWHEVLLGNHVHENYNVLNEFTDTVSASKDIERKTNMIVSVTPDGHFELNEVPANLGLPGLPDSVIGKIERYNYLKSIEVEDSSYHHLDAAISDLSNNYDYLNNVNVALGSCQELYDALNGDRKRVYYVNKELVVDDVSNHGSEDIYFTVQEKKISTDTQDNANFQLINNAIYIETEDAFNLSKDILFINKKTANSLNYTLLTYGVDFTFTVNNKSLTIIFGNGKVTKDDIVAVIIGKYANAKYTEIYELLNVGIFNARTIQDSIISGYIESKLSEKIEVPHLYLSIDNEGNTYWDNTLLPSQTFYKKTLHLYKNANGSNLIRNLKEKKFKVTNSETNSIESPTLKYITFTNVNFNYDLTTEGKQDFPLLMINDAIAFDVKYAVNGSSLDFYFKDNDQLYKYGLLGDKDEETGNYTEAETVDVYITLLVVRNSANNSIADEIARNYVSKKDAVSILSNGTIDLSDYATKSDLLKVSKVGHTHSEYSRVGHNHDSRYAMYKHTHPEISAVMAEIINSEASENRVYDLIHTHSVRVTVTSEHWGDVATNDGNISGGASQFGKELQLIPGDTEETTFDFVLTVDSDKEITSLKEIYEYTTGQKEHSENNTINCIGDGVLLVPAGTVNIDLTTGHEQFPSEIRGFYITKDGEDNYTLILETREDKVKRFISLTDFAYTLSYDGGTKVNHEIRYKLSFDDVVTDLHGNEGPKKVAESQIENWIKEIFENNNESLLAVLRELNITVNEEGKFIINDVDLILSNEIIETINEKIREINAFNTKVNYEELVTSKTVTDENGVETEVPVHPTVFDALKYMSIFFLEDTVTDNQVLLEDDIEVSLDNGPIGGIRESKTYKKGTKLQTILRDILNPYVDKDSVINNLLPVKEYTTINWFIREVLDEEAGTYVYNPISQDRIFDKEGRYDLFFEVVPMNKDNRACESATREWDSQTESTKTVIQKPQLEIGLKTDITVSGTESVSVDGHTYYKYKTNYSFIDQNQESPAISVFWDRKVQYKDNYGIESFTLPDVGEYGQTIFEIPVFFKYDYFDFYTLDYIYNELLSDNNKVSGETGETVYSLDGVKDELSPYFARREDGEYNEVELIGLNNDCLFIFVENSEKFSNAKLFITNLYSNRIVAADDFASDNIRFKLGNVYYNGYHIDCFSDDEGAKEVFAHRIKLIGGER